jgi:hypothetical protein
VAGTDPNDAQSYPGPQVPAIPWTGVAVLAAAICGVARKRLSSGDRESLPRE